MEEEEENMTREITAYNPGPAGKRYKTVWKRSLLMPNEEEGKSECGECRSFLD
jgi:hypothetical protein